MDWFKHNYGKTALLLASLLLLVLGWFLFAHTQSFQALFEPLTRTPVKSSKLPELPTEAVRATVTRTGQPPTWAEQEERPLFVSDPYLVKDDGTLIQLRPDGVPIHPPIPNKWFQDNKLDILSSSILEEDSDGDHFTNREEYYYSTSPSDPKSTPPGYVLLSLAESNRKNNRLIFQSYTGDTFAINTVDIQQPTQFLEMGQAIRGGLPYKLKSFEKKIEQRKMGGSQVLDVDVSELTIEHAQDQSTVVLPREKIVDVGEFFAVLNDRGQEKPITVRRNQTFELPASGEKLKLVDIQPDGVILQGSKPGEEAIKVTTTGIPLPPAPR